MSTKVLALSDELQYLAKLGSELKMLLLVFASEAVPSSSKGCAAVSSMNVTMPSAHRSLGRPGPCVNTSGAQ
eukprot:CAMPEP_0119392006 /NCGR_PEP_ID=MMETSP1334-20130426/119531_1 /TAXON_ID=127549 /ORGANISM="Calcidiscus leptoporus, Strain RCC1130" /LENGTH=71 /DNA_ID=CAMNT_0007414795 /DNA_START=16 /DNA_END=231 /DNA_ORIENTATION=-